MVVAWGVRDRMAPTFSTYLPTGVARSMARFEVT
jgi:hypothetical protein